VKRCPAGLIFSPAANNICDSPATCVDGGGPPSAGYGPKPQPPSISPSRNSYQIEEEESGVPKGNAVLHKTGASEDLVVTDEDNFDKFNYVSAPKRGGEPDQQPGYGVLAGQPPSHQYSNPNAGHNSSSSDDSASVSSSGTEEASAQKPEQQPYQPVIVQNGTQSAEKKKCKCEFEFEFETTIRSLRSRLLRPIDGQKPVPGATTARAASDSDSDTASARYRPKTHFQ